MKMKTKMKMKMKMKGRIERKTETVQLNSKNLLFPSFYLLALAFSRSAFSRSRFSLSASFLARFSCESLSGCLCAEVWQVPRTHGLRRASVAERRLVGSTFSKWAIKSRT